MSMTHSMWLRMPELATALSLQQWRHPHISLKLNPACEHAFQEQQDTEFLDMFTKRGVPGHDTLRRKILAVRQRLRTELLDQGLLACMPSAERIAAALVFCALDGDKAQRLLRHNGAGVLLWIFPVVHMHTDLCFWHHTLLSACMSLI